ncbi:hypothetical protein YZUPF006_000011 [Pseudomonas phage YZU-PF-006]
MIRQIHEKRSMDCTNIIEVGTRDSAIRVSETFFVDSPEFIGWARYAEMAHRPHPDLVMLYEYLKESGRVIHLTPTIASQTIQFLKETN